MKKSLLAVLLAVAMAGSASAGMWVGGNFGYSAENVKDNSNATTWSVTPEVGFNLSEKWDLGLNVGYGSSNERIVTYAGGIWEYGHTVTDTKTWAGQIFARYKVFSIGDFSVLIKGAIGYSNSTQKSEWGDITEEFGSPDIKTDTIYVSFVPVVSYNINDSWSIEAELNFADLTYASGKTKVDGFKDKDTEDFGFNLNNGSLAKIGFSYHF